MSIDGFLIGQGIDVTHPEFRVSPRLQSRTQLSFEIMEGPFSHAETFAIEVAPLREDVFAVSWAEDSGGTVTDVQDYDRGLGPSLITLPAGGLP